jgi:amidophosphoribosyltransferase
MLARPHDPAIAETYLARERASSGADKIVPPKNVLAPAWPAWVARIAAFMKDCEGAYSLVILTRDAVYGVRDHFGLRPLCVGKQKQPDGTDSFLVASESCAFGTVGAEYVREVQPGEIVRLDIDGIHSFFPLREMKEVVPRRPAFCVFEYVYFARPDSILEGQMVHNVRTTLGAQLAKEHPVLAADIVSGVPDSSIAAAIGFSTHSGIPFSEVFCKNRYIGRTFIKPDDALRKNAIQLKYNPLTHVLRGKRVVLVDDSLVRGNTLAQLVPLLRAGGAVEVHVRISSPPIRHPCFMGVDIGTYDELIAHKIEDVKQICDHIGADSLEYLSYAGMMTAVNAGISPSSAGSGEVEIEIADCNTPTRHCAACFTGGRL